MAPTAIPCKWPGWDIIWRHMGMWWQQWLHRDIRLPPCRRRSGNYALLRAHSGTPAEESNFESPTISESCIWELPRDISTALSQVVTGPFLGKNIDSIRIGAGKNIRTGQPAGAGFFEEALGNR